jgi:hypothetical protein
MESQWNIRVPDILGYVSFIEEDSIVIINKVVVFEWNFPYMYIYIYIPLIAILMQCFHKE